jgi:hypothetical protein
LEKIGSFPVQKRITMDGYKFLLPDGEWVAFRASGTEPVSVATLKPGPGRTWSLCGKRAGRYLRLYFRRAH